MDGDLTIVGGTVIADGRSRAGDVAIRAGRVADAPAAGAPVLDARGLLVAPGLIDLQVNGAAGIDLASEPERWPEVGRHLTRHGVTAWCPTLVSSPPAMTGRALAALGPPADDVAAPLGWHLEGPMLADRFHGAHAREHLRAPAPGVYAGWSADAGVALVTLAPELPGAADAVRALAARGVAVSIGHSGAGPEHVRAAVDAGASAVTHLFNAMAPLHHRDVGTAGAVLAEPRLRCGLIADGVHVHPEVVRLVWRLLGPGRTVLVSDAVAALGAPPGRYRLGTVEIVCDGTRVQAPEGGLGGACAGLDAGLRTLVAAGATPADAVTAATAGPATVLGLSDRGHLRPGAVGDVVLLTPVLEVAATVVRGRVAYRAPAVPAPAPAPA